MKESRNKGKKKNNKSDESLDYKKDSADAKDFDLDNINEDKNSFDDDYSEDSDISDEINKKINSIYDKNKSFLESNNNNNNNEEVNKNDVKKKIKYEQKIMGNKFNEYFDAEQKKIEDYYEVNYPGLNKYALKIDIYSDLFKLISKNEIFPNLLNNEDVNKNEKNNSINQGNLFKLMYDLLFHNFNVFLYGFGSKMNIAYEFIDYYQKKYYEESNVPLY